MPMFDDHELPVQIPGCNIRIQYIDGAGIPRTRDDRPVIRRPCPNSLEGSGLPAEGDYCIAGRIPSVKRPGNTIRCPQCKGAGELWKIHTRVTTYIGCLEDETNIEKWHIQRLMQGLSRKPGYLRQIQGFDWETLDRLDRARKTCAASDEEVDALKSLKRLLNQWSEELQQAGGVDRSSDQGTHVHELTAEVDLGRPLPDHTYVASKDMRIETTLQDRADVAAVMRTWEELEAEVLAVEKFVVLDELGVAGTADRVLRVNARRICDQCDLPIIGDLKTGSILYGGGEMPQQLAIYARAVEYDPATGVRTPQGLCTHRGLIINVPAGTGHATCYVADLEAGWRSVELSTRVRAHRNESKAHLWPLEELAA